MCYADDFMASLSSITVYEPPVEPEVSVAPEPSPTLSPNEVKIPSSALEYSGQNYEEVVASLTALGFTDIKTEPSYDIYFGFTAEKSIKNISIGDNSRFESGDVFNKSSQITIVYHMPYADDPSYIKIPHESGYYDGMDYLEVVQLFKDLGFTNIVTTSKNSSIFDDGEVFSIVYGKYSFDFYEGEAIKKDEQITIKYYIAESETASPEVDTSEIVLPPADSKLAKDFDTKGQTTIYYINVDGRYNEPILKGWKSATVTDGVAEYLDYLEDLGFKVTITGISVKEPYSGFHVYETIFDVSNSKVSWTMLLTIQDELYVEYELDIHLP